MTGGSHFDSDDTLYAEMAREMVNSGNLLDNQWSGTVLFEKPPLYLWSLAISGHFLGWDEAAMRLPGTLFSIGALLAFWWLMRGMGLSPPRALTAVGLLATSYFFLLLTRRLMTDVPLLCCVLSSSAAFVHGRLRWSGLFAGAALLAKGLAAGPLLLALLVFAFVSGRLRALGARRALEGVVCALLVGAPWHLAETLRHGSEFWSGYVGYHVGSRATSLVVPGLTLSELGAAGLEEGLLLVGGLVGLLMAAWSRWRDRSQTDSSGESVSTEDQAGTEVELFAFIWLLCSLIPVVMSTTRLPHYLLPVVPAFCLFSVTAVPLAFWKKRMAPLVAGMVVVLAFVWTPAKLVFWLDPNFGADEKVLGEAIARTAVTGDLTATYNTTSSALTFYSGGHRFLIAADDPRFYEVQDAVLMVQRAGVLVALEPSGFPAADAGGRRFVVARADPDLDALVTRMHQTVPNRPLYVLHTRDSGGLALVNDAGIGEPVGGLGARL
jgi:4-amino-4-deoxy-L-arabinose transferase-like glycosyltransferase